MGAHTRPRPSSIDLLPEECEAVVAWAAQELARSDKAKTDIYSEFKEKLTALKDDLELSFEIPHFSSFNRHAMSLAKLTHRMNRAQRIADAVIKQGDGQDADNLTLASTRMLKTLIVEMMENADDDGFSPKEANASAAALYRIAMAENVSTARRQKVEQEFKDQAKAAVAAVGKAKGVSQEAMDEINRRLGVV